MGLLLMGKGDWLAFETRNQVRVYATTEVGRGAHEVSTAARVHVDVTALYGVCTRFVGVDAWKGARIYSTSGSPTTVE